jgi:hypothetical protein
MKLKLYDIEKVSEGRYQYAEVIGGERGRGRVAQGANEKKISDPHPSRIGAKSFKSDTKYRKLLV